MSKSPHRERARGGFALLVAFAVLFLLAPAANGATLTIDIEGVGGAAGAVSDGTGAIDCTGPPLAGNCSAAFAEDIAQPFLTATPGPSSVFTGWTGLEGGAIGIPEDNCYGMVNPCMVWLSSDRTVTATFAPADSQDDCETEEPELGRYIVVLYDWVEDPGAVGRAHVEKYGGTLGFVYRYALKGYSAGFPPSAIPSLENEPEVSYVEEDQPVELFGVASSPGEPPGDGCGPEPPEGWPEPEPGLDSEPPASGPDSGSVGPDAAGLQSVPTSAVSPAAAGDAAGGGDNAAADSSRRAARAGRCRKGTARQGGRCRSKRRLAIRVCRRREGTGSLRCRVHRARGLGSR